MSKDETTLSAHVVPPKETTIVAGPTIEEREIDEINTALSSQVAPGASMAAAALRTPKDAEFVTGKLGPAVVTIKKNSGVWEIEPTGLVTTIIMHYRKVVDLSRSKSHKNESARNEWHRRRLGGAPADPHFIMHPLHTPLVIREGEEVEFRCDPPFEFDVEMPRDINVALEPPPNQGPDDPFGWGGMAQPSIGGKVMATVERPGPNGGPADQRFYKIRAVVYENGRANPGTPVDPDGVCDR